MKQLEELKHGDVIKMSAETRVVLFVVNTRKKKGYCYARLNERGDTWDVEMRFGGREIRGHDHDSFVTVTRRAFFEVVGNVTKAG